MEEKETKKSCVLIRHQDYKSFRNKLTDEKKGQLLDILMDLSLEVSSPDVPIEDLTEDYPLPEIDDPVLQIAVEILGATVVNDTCNYRRKSEQNKQNRNSKRTDVNDRQRSSTVVNGRQRPSEFVREKEKEKEREKENDNEKEKETDWRSGLSEGVLSLVDTCGYKQDKMFFAMLNGLEVQFGEEILLEALRREKEAGKTSPFSLTKECAWIYNKRYKEDANND